MSLLPLINSRLSWYTKNHLENNNNVLLVIWYNQEFSQSRFPPGQKVSKACTLICLLVAQRIAQKGLLLRDVEKSPPEIVSIIADSMIEGNAIHAWIIKNGLVSHPYLSTEEALKFGGTSLSLLREWTFQVFYERIEHGLFRHMSDFLREWYSAPKSSNLFMLLITCGRTVLFIFQQNTYMVTFFDSHSHGTAENPNRGLVIAQVGISIICNCMYARCTKEEDCFTRSLVTDNTRVKLTVKKNDVDNYGQTGTFMQLVHTGYIE